VRFSDIVHVGVETTAKGAPKKKQVETNNLYQYHQHTSAIENMNHATPLLRSNLRRRLLGLLLLRLI
jgi:hypothetical protein